METSTTGDTGQARRLLSCTALAGALLIIPATVAPGFAFALTGPGSRSRRPLARVPMNHHRQPVIDGPSVCGVTDNHRHGDQGSGPGPGPGADLDGHTTSDPVP